MTKTNETIALENALKERSISKREYGIQEVTIGFAHNGHGDEIVDYMSMDANAVFKCYEIKVTLSDLKSDNAKSWYGDYNYLVISESLYQLRPAFDNYIPPYCGILVGESLKAVRKAKQRTISDQQRNMLRDSLLRSMYWKLIQYRTSGDMEQLKLLQKQNSENELKMEELKRFYDEKIWIVDDYERYYARNHQLDSFTIAMQAKEERRQFFLRKEGKMSWIEKEGQLYCPLCGKKMIGEEKTPYCPHCGADLRKID